MLGIFLDQETTGLDSYRHKLLEVACVIMDLHTGEEKGSYESVVFQPESVWNDRDVHAIEVNGFTQGHLIKGKTQEVIGREIQELFTACGIERGKALFICANPSFDRPFFYHLIDCYAQEKLNWPYHWLDLASMYWALEIQKAKRYELELPEKLILSKDTIAQNLSLAKEEKPHRAMQGVKHLLLCYEHLVGWVSPVLLAKQVI